MAPPLVNGVIEIPNFSCDQQHLLFTVVVYFAKRTSRLQLEATDAVGHKENQVFLRGMSIIKDVLPYTQHEAQPLLI